MTDPAPVLWLNLAIFNLSIIFLLRYALRNIDVKEVLREKSPSAQPQAAPALAAVVAPEGAGAAVVVPPAPAPPAAPDNTSYSRVAGMLGAIILAAFFWAMGNVILYKVFASTGAEIKDLTSGVGTYILSGSALFAPYAVNQLTTIFKP